MTNGWTGGQYSVFRFLFGSYLLIHFAHLMPWGAELFSNLGMLANAADSPLYPLFPNVLFLWDSPTMVGLVIVSGIAGSLALAFGRSDRIAALVLWYAWACLFTRNPLIANPGLPFVGWLLLLHAAIPDKPFGAWDTRGRLDPDSGWRLPNALFVTAWIVMAIGYSYSGITKLVSPSWIDGTALVQVLGNPLARPTFLRETLLALPSGLMAVATWGALAAELLFAPLALIRPLRKWLWLALLCMHLGLMTLIDFADLSAGMVLLHLFTFDPAWVRARLPSGGGPTIIFYDGACGFCHRTVRFLLAEDAAGERFRFAPIDSDGFRAACAAPGSGFAPGDPIPDSVLVARPGEPLLARSEGVLEVGQQLGGLWRIASIAVGLLPLGLLNAAYDGFARIRHELFARPDDACPILPAHLRERFDY